MTSQHADGSFRHDWKREAQDAGREIARLLDERGRLRAANADLVAALSRALPYILAAIDDDEAYDEPRWPDAASDAAAARSALGKAGA